MSRAVPSRFNVDSQDRQDNPNPHPILSILSIHVEFRCKTAYFPFAAHIACIEPAEEVRVRLTSFFSPDHRLVTPVQTNHRLLMTARLPSPPIFSVALPRVNLWSIVCSL